MVNNKTKITFTAMSLASRTSWSQNVISISLNVYLRGHAATDLKICCTVFPSVFFRFQCEVPMCFDPFKSSNRLLALKMASDMTTENSTLAVLLSKIALFSAKSRWPRGPQMASL